MGDQFVVGNVLETPLHEIVSAAKDANYVRDFFAGLRQCRSTCSYYSYCGGGQASNKYCELGRLDATETAHCRNTKQAVVDAVLEQLSNSSLSGQSDQEKHYASGLL